MSYTYDLLGDQTSSSTGLFVTYTYGYNSAARLNSVVSSRTGTNLPPSLLSAVKYNAFGSVVSDSLGDGETETFVYDKRLRLQSSNAVLSSTPIYSFSLGFAPNSNVLTSNDSANLNWVYNYDAFNRLTCSNLATNGTCAAPTNGTPTYTYTYDRFGNRWNQTGPNTFNATFTGNNPGNPQNNNRLDGYSYDAAGNLLSDKTYTYTYDAENRISAVTGNGTNATYVYDANGLRVEKTGNVAESCSVNGTGYYLHDLQGRTIPYPTSSGVDQCRDEVYAGNRHLVTYAGDIWFIHSDWLGTERAKFDLTYQAAQLCASLPFGDALSCTGGGAIDNPGPTHFTGKERDTESGLDNFGARYDSSSMGRFMSPDPDNAGASMDNPQSWNAYSYVLNNPLNAIDPTGLDCVYTADAEGNPNAGSLTIVHGDCTNKGGKDDGGVFVDNDANHPVQNSDVTMSENGSVGLVSYTNANGVTTGYACVGNCPADSVQVTAAPPGTPTMSAALTAESAMGKIHSATNFPGEARVGRRMLRRIRPRACWPHADR